jgi:hypothetical protein
MVQISVLYKRIRERVAAISTVANRNPKAAARLTWVGAKMTALGVSRGKP